MPSRLRLGTEPNVAPSRWFSVSLFNEQGHKVNGWVHLGVELLLDEFAQAAAAGVIESTANRDFPFSEVRQRRVYDVFRKLYWVFSLNIGYQ